MTHQQLTAIKDYIKAVVRAHAAEDSSDGGLSESIAMDDAEQRLDNTFLPDPYRRNNA